MKNNIKKNCAIFSMILFLCISSNGIMAKADDKVDKTNETTSNQNTSDNRTTTENKTNTSVLQNNTGTSQGNVGTSSTNIPGTGVVVQNPSNPNGIQGKDSTAVKVEEILPNWQKKDGKLYYVTKDGIVKDKGWFKEKDVNPDAINDNEYYLDDNYAATIGWKKIDDLWYYFDEAGIKQKGWKLVDYAWYHLDKDGVMEKGWIKDNGYKYYLNDSGIMTIGKKNIDNKWYFFSTSGILETGFYGSNGKLYYSDKDGVMVANEWIKTNSNKYYVKADSGLAVGDAIIDGKAEQFDSEGKYIGPGQMKDHLFIKYLNVGDADCAFIKLPSGETVLIDTGDPKTSDKVVRFLKDQDLKQEDGKGVIDYIVITHGHSDHIGGLASILDNFKVNKVYMPDKAKMQDWYSNVQETAENTKTIEMLKEEYLVYQDAEKAMKDKNKQFINTKSGEFIDKNKVLQFMQDDKKFGPVGSEKITAEYWGLNDNSAIVYLNYGDVHALFTGDMEWSAEKDFAVNKFLNGKKVDILKVPHHGRDTSSTADFISYVKPTIGVISRSKENKEDNAAFKNLISDGVSVYETNEKDGVSINATEQNWILEK